MVSRVPNLLAYSAVKAYKSNPSQDPESLDLPKECIDAIKDTKEVFTLKSNEAEYAGERPWLAEEIPAPRILRFLNACEVGNVGLIKYFYYQMSPQEKYDLQNLKKRPVKPLPENLMPYVSQRFRNIFFSQFSLTKFNPMQLAILYGHSNAIETLHQLDPSFVDDILVDKNMIQLATITGNLESIKIIARLRPQQIINESIATNEILYDLKDLAAMSGNPRAIKLIDELTRGEKAQTRAADKPDILWFQFFFANHSLEFIDNFFEQHPDFINYHFAGKNILFHACEMNKLSLALLKKLYFLNPLLISEVDGDGDTLIHKLIDEYDPDITSVEELIDMIKFIHDKDPNLINLLNVRGRSVFHEIFFQQGSLKDTKNFNKILEAVFMLNPPANRNTYLAREDRFPVWFEIRDVETLLLVKKYCPFVLNETDDFEDGNILHYKAHYFDLDEKFVEEIDKINPDLFEKRDNTGDRPLDKADNTTNRVIFRIFTKFDMIKDINWRRIIQSISLIGIGGIAAAIATFVYSNKTNQDL